MTNRLVMMRQHDFCAEHDSYEQPCKGCMFDLLGAIVGEVNRLSVIVKQLSREETEG